MQLFHFGCTALVGTNKTGNIPMDADGYRTVVLGGLNMYNSGGAFYTGGPDVTSLFEQSSPFVRRMRNQALRGELGHPKRLPGMTDKEYMARGCAVYEQCVSHHISDVWCDDTLFKGADGQPVIAIMGKVKPAGPYADVLERAFNNPRENVCFSIRAITDDIYRYGRMEKTIRVPITWDNVNEPGISIAEKFSCPSMESLDESNQLVVTRSMVDLLIERRNVLGLGMESDASLLEEIRVAVSSRRPTTNEFTVAYGSSQRWK